MATSIIHVMKRCILNHVTKVFDNITVTTSTSSCHNCIRRSFKSISTSSRLLENFIPNKSGICFGSLHFGASQLKRHMQLPKHFVPASIVQSVLTNRSQPIHTSCIHNGLEEFFDDPKTYGEPDVKSGRPWDVHELRLKDNVTLQKLWYVLLKEKNMLLTMEEEAEKQEKLMPSPERLRKVKRSMRNLQQVVCERNEAVTDLRTGHPEEHPGKMVYTPFGYQRYIKPREHYVPMYANKRYHRKRYRYKPFVYKNLRLWMEKERSKRILGTRRHHNQIAKLRKRFPDADVWKES